MHFAVILAATACGSLGLAATGRATTGPAGPVRVLFIGNSYTYVHDMPAIFCQLAAADKALPKVQAEKVVAGGWTLKRHWDSGGALKKLRAGTWDYVVLQEQSLMPYLHPEVTAHYARLWDAEIRKAGAKTVFYMTWQREPTEQLRRKYPGMYQGLRKAYTSMAAALGAIVVPAGVAWHDVTGAHPPWHLYARDHSHPSPIGAYLTACVFYATLFEKSPVGLPRQFTAGSGGQVALPAGMARGLQEAAWAAVQATNTKSRPKPDSPADTPPARARERESTNP